MRNTDRRVGYLFGFGFDSRLGADRDACTLSVLTLSAAVQLKLFIVCWCIKYLSVCCLRVFLVFVFCFSAVNCIGLFVVAGKGVFTINCIESTNNYCISRQEQCNGT